VYSTPAKFARRLLPVALSKWETELIPVSGFRWMSGFRRAVWSIRRPKPANCSPTAMPSIAAIRWRYRS